MLLIHRLIFATLIGIPLASKPREVPLSKHRAKRSGKPRRRWAPHKRKGLLKAYGKRYDSPSAKRRGQHYDLAGASR
jgi:hypothetical protein